jgi:predicted nucleotide-binding protein (sugar kinase/HSP70/actin superfamily)
MTIGIPRALSYYYYYPFWFTFFKELGLQLVSSGLTNRQKLDTGIRVIPSEACLPLKCYFGHLLSLQETADCIFIPRLVCMQKDPGIRLGCPKLIGLPDMAKALIPQMNILSIDIDLRIESEEASYVNLARMLGFSKRTGVRAYKYAKEHNDLPRRQKAYKLGTTNAPDKKPLIGLLGHAYLLNDEYLNLNIIRKIEDSGASVVNCHDLDQEEIENAREDINPVSWYFEEHILSAAYLFQHAMRFSGIIYLLSFGCGAGSITHEVIDYELGTPRAIPFLKIMLDEHTGETGIMTRIESFLDMIRLKKREVS